MILPNNPLIDPEIIEQHLAVLMSRRRSEAPRPLVGAVSTVPRLTLRQRVRTVPVIGSSLAFFLRRWRRFFAAGVSTRERIKAIPVFGDLLHLLWVLPSLPRFRAVATVQMASLTADLQHHRLQMQQELAAVRHELQQQLSAARRDLEVSLAEQGALRTDLARYQQAYEAMYEQLRQAEALRAQALAVQLADLDAHNQGTRRALDQAMAAQTQALRRIERSIGDASALPAAKEAQGRQVIESSLALDNFYVAFENKFRGDRSAIKERCRPYLGVVREALANITNPVCVDVGCGRGEWLELLHDEGFEVLCVDLNESMVQSCLDLGLKAQRGDGLQWLRSQPPGSVDVITAFQVIEHLGFEQMLALFDATLQALSPRGVAIFETPNPENLLVGACNFYYDPTHQHPIPPAVAAFFAEHTGFGRVEIVRLNAYPPSYHVPGDTELTRRLNPLLYGPQDYAVVLGRHHVN